MVGDPWKQQRELKKADIPSYNDMCLLMNKFTKQRDKAYFVLSYLTGGRCSEIVKTTYLRKVLHKYEDVVDKHGNIIQRVLRNKYGSPIQGKVYKIPIDYPGILRENISQEIIRGKKILIIKMPNRKNKKYNLKSIPIPVDKEPEMLRELFRYLVGKPESAPLFNFQKWTAYKILLKVNMNPHFLRDIRLTHLVTKYHYNAFQLQKFAGWSNINPAERYVRLGVVDLVENF